MGVSLPWKIEYLNDFSIIIRCIARKMAAIKGGLV